MSGRDDDVEVEGESSTGGYNRGSTDVYSVPHFSENSQEIQRPNELMFPGAKRSLSDSLIYAIKEVCRFLKTHGFNTGLFLRAAPV